MTAASELTVAALRAEVRVDLDDFRREIEVVKRQAQSGSRDISHSFDGVKRSIDGLSPALSSFRNALGAVGIGLGLGAAVGLGRKALETADSIDKMSRQIGISAEALQELRFAAQLNGVEQATLDNALRKVTVRAAQAARGVGESKDAFAELSMVLGRQIDLLAPTDQILNEVADALEKIPNPADRARLAVKLFEEEGVSLVNVLRGGSEALNDFRSQASVISDEEIQDLVRFKDEIDKVIDKVGSTLVSALGRAAIAVRNFFDATGVRDTAGLDELDERLAELRESAGRLQAELAGITGNDIASRAQASGLQVRLQALGRLIDELESRKMKLEEPAARPDAGATGGLSESPDQLKKLADARRRFEEQLEEELVRSTGTRLDLIDLETDRAIEAAKALYTERGDLEKALTTIVDIGVAKRTEIRKEELKAERDAQLERDRARISEEIRANRDRTREIERAVEKSNDRLAEAAKEQQEKLREFSRDTAERILQDGRLSFRGLAEAFKQEFLTRAIAGLIESGLTDIGGLLRGVKSGGGSGSGLAGLALGAAGLFAGFFADGGRIPAGKFGIAGERGPEPVLGPATVLPNGALGGGGNLVVNLITDQPAQNVQVREAGQSGGDRLLQIVVGQVNEGISRGVFDRTFRRRFHLTPRTS